MSPAAPESPLVVVVGSGPAGAAAAHRLASGGARVVVLERSRHPRDKVCGEGCTPRAVRSLERMGLLDSLAERGAWVRSAHLVSPGGIELRTALPPHIYGGQALVVRRQVLDEALVQRAVRAGAELREGVRVLGVDRDESGVLVRCAGCPDIRAEVVMGCDGFGSVVRRSLGVRRLPLQEHAFAIRAIYQGVSTSSDPALTLVWDRSVLPGYGWVFPLPGGLANVGIGMRAHHLRRSKDNLRGIFERFLRLPFVSGLLRGAQPLEPARGHPLPFTPWWGPCVRDRALLAGDAAGFVNPLTGEGIEYAIETGEFAADAVLAAAKAGDFRESNLGGYARACAREFRSIFVQNGVLRLVFAAPWLLDRIFRAGLRSRQVCEQVAEVALAGPKGSITGRLVAAAVFGA